MSCSDAALNKDVIGGIVKVSMISYHFELSNDVKKDPVNLVCFRWIKIEGVVILRFTKSQTSTKVEPWF